MLDIQRFGMPMELRLELGTIVGLQDVDAESLSNLIKELDSGRAFSSLVWCCLDLFK